MGIRLRRPTDEQRAALLVGCRDDHLTYAPTGALSLAARSGLTSDRLDLGKSVRGEMCVTDGPDQSALAIDDRDALEKGGPKQDVRRLEGRAGIEDDRVRRHHVGD